MWTFIASRECEAVWKCSWVVYPGKIKPFSLRHVRNVNGWFPSLGITLRDEGREKFREVVDIAALVFEDHH